jgi:hypothetical protein
MIPVVVLVIYIGALSSDFLTLFCLTVACPYIQHIPGIYLTMVAATAIMLIQQTSAQSAVFITSVVNDTILAHFALSLLINIYATSLIALKAWCVCFNRITGKFSTYCPFVDDTMRTYIQEIPQVADGKWRRYPSPYTGNQDIDCRSRVGYDLYSDWCRFFLVYTQGLSRLLFSLQMTILSSISITLQSRNRQPEIIMPVAQQLVVRNIF